MGATLRLDRICKRYPGTRALHEVAFDAFPGQVSAIVGQNGAGKSTLIKIVAGAIRKDSGSVEVAGRGVEIQNPAHARSLGISVIYQDFSLLRNLTIAENLFLGREYRSGWLLNNREQKRAAARLMDMVGLGHYAPGTEVSVLSNPEKQMLEIAKALSMEAKIVLMDEPSAVLTDAELGHLYRQLELLTNKGVAVIYVSHRLDEVLRVSDSITVLKDGQKVDYMGRSEASHGRIVRAMVGRDLTAYTDPASREAGEVLLEVNNLHWGRAVHGVNLTLRRGEIVGLAGLVGAGRTELARCIFGDTVPDQGTIRLRGRPTSFRNPNDAVRAGIGLVPEDRKTQGVLLDLSVRDNVTLANLDHYARLSFLNHREEDLAARRFVHSLGIKTPSTRQAVGSLSGGNQQKVALSKWLARDCDLVVLDEPTQGVDVGARAEIYQILRRLAASGKGVLVISSDFEEVVQICDRVLVMYKGQIVQELSHAQATEERILSHATGGGHSHAH